ncbi:aquaporin [Candidatus Saccharibacteria bacterium]|nr:aquaporin [Candidatus Saccharibacteria bacterium]
MKVKNINLEPAALLAEVVGTFVLATVALTIGQPLLVGLTLVVLIFTIASVSGAHVNPLVTFGLWSVKKFEGIKVPFYWAAQFAGALFALVAVQLYRGDSLAISFSNFWQFDTKIAVAELIGAAIFALAITSVVQRKQVEAVKAAAIGLGLMAGLYVGGGLLNQAAQNVSLTQKEAPRVTQVDGVVVNPAIALAATEKADQGLQQSFLGGEDEKKADATPSSRLGLETILGSLVGAALGANLYMVLVGENPFKKKSTPAKVAAKVKTTVKKTAKKAKK